MDHDAINRLCAARLLSECLAATDLVEAVYAGTDPRLAEHVGRWSLWVVTGERDGIALVSPHPLPMHIPAPHERLIAPVTDFERMVRAGNLLDD